MSAPKILIIPGSLRTGSHNAKLAAVAAYAFDQAGVDRAAELEDAAGDVTRISLADFPLPIYDGDLQAKSGVPKHAINLKRMIGAHDGVLIVSPEYNASVPPLLKNAIDWVSRVHELHEPRGEVFRNRVFALAGASALRLILTSCHANVIASQLTLAFADQAYDDMDRLKHEGDIAALKELVRQLIDVSQRMM